MRRAIQLLLVLTSGFAAACSSERGNAAVTLTVDTVGRIVRYRYSAPVAIDTLKPVVTIGPEAGSPDSGFGRVSSIALNDDGTVFVADAQNLNVSAYDASGRQTASFGRTGQGPGEFRVLSSLSLLGDTLLTLDGGNARISLFQRSGQFIGTWPWLRLTGSPTMVRFFETAEHEVSVMGLPRAGAPRGPTYIQLRTSGAGDTTSFGYLPQPTGTTLQCPRPDQGITFFTTPFARTNIAVPAPNRMLAVVTSEQYEIALLAPSGDTVKVIARDYEPLQVTDDEWNAATAEYEDFKKAWPTVRCEPNEMQRPAQHSAVKGIYFDRDGRMIVEVTASKAVRYDVYTDTSVRTFILPVRDANVPPTFRSRWIAQVIKDSMDLQSVQVFNTK